MNILIIDTATSVEIVALSKGTEYFEEINEVDVSHSATLFGSIDAVFKKAGLKLKDLQLIGVGIGPGSFTGIRIAVTTARMLSQILKLPIVGIKTHLMYAHSAAEKARPGENILIAFDAKKGRVFGALYIAGKAYPDIMEIVPPGDYDIGLLIDYIDLAQKTILIGDGCEKYYERIRPAAENHELLLKYRPIGKHICHIVEKIYMEDPGKWNDLKKILPFYSRKSDAEIMKEARNETNTGK